MISQSSLSPGDVRTSLQEPSVSLVEAKNRRLEGSVIECNDLRASWTGQLFDLDIFGFMDSNPKDSVRCVGVTSHLIHPSAAAFQNVFRHAEPAPFDSIEAELQHTAKELHLNARESRINSCLSYMSCIFNLVMSFKEVYR